MATKYYLFPERDILDRKDETSPTFKAWYNPEIKEGDLFQARKIEGIEGMLVCVVDTEEGLMFSQVAPYGDGLFNIGEFRAEWKVALMDITPSDIKDATVLRVFESALARLKKSKTWLASECGMSPQNLNRFLSKKSKPRPARLVQICDACNLTTSERSAVANSYAYLPLN